MKCSPVAPRSCHRILLAGLALAMVLCETRVGATGIKPNVRKGSDIVMKDRRWPAWDQGTYYCFWYVKFIAEDKNSPTFYGGLVTKGPDKRPGMFVSYFGHVANVNEGMGFYRHGYGAEGSKGGVNGRVSYLRPKAWYRHVLRVFPPVEGAEGRTFVGWWFKDVEKGKWYTHSVVSIAMKSPGVHGNSGFVEALAPETVPRAFDRRLGYCRVDGKWHKSNTITTKSPHCFKLVEDGTVLRYERSAPDRESSAADVLISTTQSDEPTLDPPAIAGARAVGHGKQVLVRWSIPESACPQLGYTLEAFSNPTAQGEPLARVAASAPHVLAKRLDVGQPAKCVRLTVTDIFDQTASVVVPVRPAVPTPASRAAPLRPGLRYAYYEAPKGQAWQKLPDFSAETLAKRGLVKSIDDTVRDAREENYAIRYTGYLHAPATGLYVCQIGTCDGSRLAVDGKVVFDNDEIHGTTLRQVPLLLTRGAHPVEFSYFKGPQRYLADKILFTWEGPGFARRPIAPADFSCRDTGELPLITMPTNLSSKDTLRDNLVVVQPKIDARGHTVSRVQFYRGRYLLGSVGAQADGSAKSTSFRNILPEGTNLLWGRLWYDENHSVDSDILVLEAKNKTEGSWSYSRLGEEHIPLAVRADRGRVSFRGDGVCLAYRKVKGDFTLTARIAELGLRSEANGYHGTNLIGLMAQRDLRRPFGTQRFGIYSLANGKTKGSADFPDLGGGYCSIPTFPNDRRWLRLVRRGTHFQSLLSRDGKVWEKAMERIYRSSSDELCVGLFFRAVPGKSRSLYQGALDRVSLTSEVPALARRPKVRREDLPRPGQLTAVIQTHQKPNVLYARTLGRGVLTSSDEGKSFRPINAGLTTPDVLSVRSIAVHPTDSAILLRGSGRVAEGRLTGSLHRSDDGGKTWTLVSNDVDFAGTGPTAAFGEVIAFSQENPDLVLAGGERNGLYLSRDAGKTWKYLGLRGERITCVAFGLRSDKPDGTFVVGTIDDREFETLGLGRPYAPSDAPGRIYWNDLRNPDKPRIRVVCELPHFGVMNCGFGTHRNFATFATTRGIFYTWGHGSIFSQRRHDLPDDVFYSALGVYHFMKQTRPGEVRLKVNTFAAPFSSAEKNPIYRSTERMTFKWVQRFKDATVSGSDTSDALNAGITCILPDRHNGNVLYLCNRNGLFKSADGGKTYERLYASGSK